MLTAVGVSVLVVALPGVWGYGVATYWAAVVPAGCLVLSLAAYAMAALEPSRTGDGLSLAFIAAGAVAVLSCLAGAAVGRRSITES